MIILRAKIVFTFTPGNNSLTIVSVPAWERVDSTYLKTAHESNVRKFKRDAAVELRRWLIHGCNDAASVLIEKHEERVRGTEPQPKRATVVPLTRDANGG